MAVVHQRPWTCTLIVTHLVTQRAEPVPARHWGIWPWACALVGASDLLGVNTAAHRPLFRTGGVLDVQRTGHDILYGIVPILLVVSHVSCDSRVADHPFGRLGINLAVQHTQQ